MSGAGIDPRTTTAAADRRLSSDTIAAARRFSSATFHEANGKRGALPAAIKPVDPGFRVCGPALTVQSPGGDNLWLHRALDVAEPGHVLVVDVGGVFEHGYWGEIMSTAACTVGLQGLVINGCVRDGQLLPKIGFPVFCRGLCIRGTGKDFDARGFINYPLLMGDVIIQPGDLIVGDGDGVVCVSADAAPDVVVAAGQREADEAALLERLTRGEKTLDVYGWRRRP